MRCTPVEKILPLYVEGDLSEQETAEVRSHLSSCDGCSRLAKEFRLSQGRLRDFAAPEFDEAFYESIRGAVLEEINSRPVTQPALFHSLRMLLSARPALAASLLLLVAFGALYALLYSRLSTRGASLVAVEGSPREIKPNQYYSSSESVTASPSVKRMEVERVRAKADGSTLRQRLRPAEQSARAVLPETAIYMGSNSPAAVPSAQSSNGAENNGAALTQEAVARMEIQTSDPNIRIIWLGRKTSE